MGRRKKYVMTEQHKLNIKNGKLRNKALKNGVSVQPDTRDLFNLSQGNSLVLKTLPMMMQDKDFRQKLRDLTIQFLSS